MRTRIIWSPVEEEWLETHSTEPINQLCIQLSKSRGAIRKKITELKYPETKPVKGKISYIGKRADCDNLFFRSKWESNCFRFLRTQKDIIKIEYEPIDFSFTDWHKKGTVSYTPDFRVETKKGYYWLEVKGYLKRVDKTKLRRFKKYYPDEFAKLFALTGSSKTTATTFFNELGVPIKWFFLDLQKKYRDVIPGWEN